MDVMKAKKLRLLKGAAAELAAVVRRKVGDMTLQKHLPELMYPRSIMMIPHELRQATAAVEEGPILLAAQVCIVPDQAGESIAIDSLSTVLKDSI